MTDIVERLKTVDISWSQEGEWCAEAADEIIKLRKDYNRVRVRLRNALYRIANMESDPEFGFPPMATVQKIAQDALDDE